LSECSVDVLGAFLRIATNGQTGARMSPAQTADPIRYGIHFITCDGPKSF
jgi:hypothetical protein